MISGLSNDRKLNKYSKMLMMMTVRMTTAFFYPACVHISTKEYEELRVEKLRAGALHITMIRITIPASVFVLLFEKVATGIGLTDLT